MEETIIKWSSKKNRLEPYSLPTRIGSSTLDSFVFAELSRRSTCGIGGFNSLYRFLNPHRWLHFVSTFATAFF